MRKLLLLTITGILSFSVTAQITITQADYGQAGDSIVVGYDNLPPTGLNVGGTGMQTWDFTTLSINNFNTLKFEDPANTISGSEFPNADLAIERLNDTLFFISTATEFVIDGFAGQGFGLPISFSADFDPNSTQIEFPSTLGDSFIDTAVIDTTVDCASFGFGSTCDSARLKRVLIGNSAFNAYGTISTPGGEFNTVRQYFREDNFDTIWIKIPILGWTQFLDSTSTEHNYRWMANGEKWPVLSVRADAAGGDIVNAEYVVGANVLGYPITEIDPSCPESCDGSASIYALGGLPPYSYAWPDGQTTAFVSGLCAGSYDVTITDSDTGSYITTVELQDPAPISIAGAVQGVSVGADGAIDISVTGGTVPYTFAWTGPDGFTASTEDIGNLDEGEYTVAVTDANGCDTTRAFSVDLTSIEAIDAASLKSYPNPVDDVMNLQSNEVIEHIRMVDILGNVVFARAEDRTEVTVQTSELASGVYLMEVQTSNGTFLKRVSVQH